MEGPRDLSPPASVAHAEFKAALLLIGLALLVGGAVLYLLYARGVFTETQKLVLTTDDAEGVLPGMDLTFSGFPIGSVRRIELAPDASVRIVIDVEQENAHWLRTSSVFTLERGIVGGTRIRAFSGILADPPLPAGAERQLLRGDAQAELPRVVIAVRELVDNLKALTDPDSALNATLANVRALSDRLDQPGGALAALLGGTRGDANEIAQLLATSQSLLARADRLAAEAEVQVFGKSGLMKETRSTVMQLNRTLADAQDSLKRVDAVLREAQKIAANAREATTDLGTLRAEVESSLRRMDQLVNEVNRRLPFAREPKIRLP